MNHFLRQAKQLDISGMFEKIMSDQFSNEKDLVEEALENVDSNYLRESLKILAKEPHIAGHRRDNELIDYIRQTWVDNGLDRVEIAEYDLYLSWPNKVNYPVKLMKNVWLNYRKVAFSSTSRLVTLQKVQKWNSSPSI